MVSTSADSVHLGEVEEKDVHRGSYSHFLKGRRPIDLGKIKVPLSREFCQASYGVGGFLGKGGRLTNEDETKETNRSGIGLSFICLFFKLGVCTRRG